MGQDGTCLHRKNKKEELSIEVENQGKYQQVIPTISQLKQPKCELGKKCTLDIQTKNHFFNEKLLSTKLICVTSV